MNNRERALTSRTFINRATKDDILNLLRPLYPAKTDNELWGIWRRQMDVIAQLLRAGHGVPITGFDGTCGILHVEVRKAREVNNLGLGPVPTVHIPPRVCVSFRQDKDFVDDINKNNFNDLRNIRPDLFVNKI